MGAADLLVAEPGASAASATVRAEVARGVLAFDGACSDGPVVVLRSATAWTRDAGHACWPGGARWLMGAAELLMAEPGVPTVILDRARADAERGVVPFDGACPDGLTVVLHAATA